MMRWYRLFVLLIPFYTFAQQPVFIIDHSQGQPVYPYDAGPSGLSLFVNKVVKPGYRFIFLDGSADTLSGLEKLDFLQNPIILIPPTIHRAFAQSGDNHGFYEWDYYLSMGAHLVFVAEHEDFYYNATNINAITDKYGLHVNATAVMSKNGEPGSLAAAWPVGKSARLGIDSIRFYLPASLKCNDKATVWATIDTSVVCATVQAGKGSITIVADYEMLWNMTPGHGIQYGNNIRFFSRLFAQLVKPVAPTPNASLNPVYKPLADIMAAKGFELVPYQNLDIAHIKPNQVVLFDKPTEYLNWPDTAYKSIKKALIIGDAQSNYLKVLEQEGGAKVLQVLGYTPTPLPINAIAAHFELSFADVIATTGGLNNPQLSICYDSAGCRLLTPQFKINATSPIHKEFYERRPLGLILYTTAANARLIDYNAPLGFDISLGPDTILPPVVGKTVDTPRSDGIIAYCKRDVFAISGNEMYYRLFQARSSLLRDRLIEWLRY